MTSAREMKKFKIFKPVTDGWLENIEEIAKKTESGLK